MKMNSPIPYTLIAILFALSSCSTSGQKPTTSISFGEIVKQVMLLCSGGLDEKRRVYLGTELSRRGGNVDAGYERLSRNAILVMVGELGIDPNKRGEAAIAIQKEYLNCVGPMLRNATGREDYKNRRVALAKCLSGCCKAFDCEDDCPMTETLGISHPSGEGKSCRSYTTTKFSCITNAFGAIWCGLRPVHISYRKMRGCMRNCKKNLRRSF